MDIAVFNKVEPDIYIDNTTLAEREAFHCAVTAVSDNLKARIRQFIFCHEGLGRSPCVLFAALACNREAEYAHILKMVQHLNPHSVLSPVSYSAVKWYLSTLN